MKKSANPANLLHVVQMRNVRKGVELDHVHACQNILVILTLGVDPNVYKILTVTVPKLALLINVEIHVQESVA